MDHGMDFMCVLYLSVPCASRCQTTDVTLTRLTRHGQSLVALSRPGLTTHELRHSPLLLDTTLWVSTPTQLLTSFYVYLVLHSLWHLS
jgi:hypothetical protein